MRRATPARQIEFPGQTTGTDYNHFATEVHALVTIPDGRRLDVRRLDTTRGSCCRSATTEIEQQRHGQHRAVRTRSRSTRAGTYDLDLYHFERTGSSWLELYAAPGTFTSLNAGRSTWSATSASGGLAVKRTWSAARAAASPAARHEPAEPDAGRQHVVLHARAVQRGQPRGVRPAQAADEVRRRVRGVPERHGGRAAELRGIAGVELDRRHARARATRCWCTRTSTSRRSCRRWSRGRTCWRFTGMNASASDPDAARDAGADRTDVQSAGLAYFTTPTPGAANGSGLRRFRRRRRSSASIAGSTTAPFQLTITTATPTAQIYYTTNGDVPDAGHRHALHGADQRRAARPRCGRRRSARAICRATVVTQTYLFLNDIVRQTSARRRSSACPRPGEPACRTRISRRQSSTAPTTAWTPTSSATSTRAAIRPAATCTAACTRRRSRTTCSRIPTLSIVMDVDDMFGASRHLSPTRSQRGIGVGAGRLGRVDRRRRLARVPGRTPAFASRAALSAATDSPRSTRCGCCSRTSTARASSTYPIFGDDRGDCRRVQHDRAAGRGERRLHVELGPVHRAVHRAISSAAACSRRPATPGRTARSRTCTSTACTGACTTRSSGPTTNSRPATSAAIPTTGTRSTSAETPSGRRRRGVERDARLGGSRRLRRSRPTCSCRARTSTARPTRRSPPLLDLDNYIDYIALNVLGRQLGLAAQELLGRPRPRSGDDDGLPVLHLGLREHDGEQPLPLAADKDVFDRELPASSLVRTVRTSRRKRRPAAQLASRRMPSIGCCSPTTCTSCSSTTAS